MIIDLITALECRHLATRQDRASLSDFDEWLLDRTERWTGAAATPTRCHVLLLRAVRSEVKSSRISGSWWLNLSCLREFTDNVDIQCIWFTKSMLLGARESRWTSRPHGASVWLSYSCQVFLYLKCALLWRMGWPTVALSPSFETVSHTILGLAQGLLIFQINGSAVSRLISISYLPGLNDSIRVPYISLIKAGHLLIPTLMEQFRGAQAMNIEVLILWTCRLLWHHDSIIVYFL